MSLTEKISDQAYYGSSIGAKEALEALDHFLALNKVNLSDAFAKDVTSAIRLGVPLSFLNRDAFDKEPFLTRFAPFFSNSAEMDADAFAELQAAALMFAFGASSIDIVPRSSLKTQDFHVLWGNAEIEVEVTKSSKKLNHIQLGKQAEDVSEALHKLGHSFDLVAHVSELLNVDTRARLLDAASKIKCGATIGEDGSWQVSSKNITREVFELMTVGADDAEPLWWPKNTAKMFSIFQICAVEGSEIAPPQAKLYSAVPLDGYLNSAKKKAQKFQGSASKPYLVAIDVCDLPRPFEVFQKGLDRLFPRWKHISGVLIFKSSISRDTAGWTVQLFRNQAASRPLPEEFCREISSGKSLNLSIRAEHPVQGVR